MTVYPYFINMFPLLQINNLQHARIMDRAQAATETPGNHTPENEMPVIETSVASKNNDLILETGTLIDFLNYVFL